MVFLSLLWYIINYRTPCIFFHRLAEDHDVSTMSTRHAACNRLINYARPSSRRFELRRFRNNFQVSRGLHVNNLVHYAVIAGDGQIRALENVRQSRLPLRDPFVLCFWVILLWYLLSRLHDIPMGTFFLVKGKIMKLLVYIRVKRNAAVKFFFVIYFL